MYIQAYLVLLHFALFSFAGFWVCFFFNKLKVCGNSASSKSNGAIFPTAFAHFMSLCPVLAILAILPAFSLLLYLLMGVSDQ